MLSPFHSKSKVAQICLGKSRLIGRGFWVEWDGVTRRAAACLRLWLTTATPKWTEEVGDVGVGVPSPNPQQKSYHSSKLSVSATWLNRKWGASFVFTGCDHLTPQPAGSDTVRENQSEPNRIPNPFPFSFPFSLSAPPAKCFTSIFRLMCAATRGSITLTPTVK